MKNKTIHITAIGCGNAFSDGGRLQTCFYVAAPGGHFLIDCGATSVAGLKRHRFDLNQIDTVLLSHFHGDHYGGLPYLLLEAAVFGRDAPLTIISPPGCRERLQSLLELLYPGSVVLEKLDLRFLEFNETVSACETEYLTVEAFPVTHAAPTDPHGLRISTAGKVIAYSGDTCWDDNLIRLARGADFFLCECNFFRTRSEVHIDYETLMERLPELDFKHIRLTHAGDEMLQHLNEIELPCAEDGMQFSI